MKPLHQLVLITTFDHINFAGSRLAVLLYAVKLGASPATLGILTALYSVLGVTTSVASGRWLDRVGPRWPMVFFSLLMGLGTLTAFALDNLVSLFVVSTVVGTSYNVYFLGNQMQVGRYGKSDDRVGNFALTMQANAAANFVAPLVTGFAIDAVGFRHTFLLLSLLPLVPATVIAVGRLGFSGPSGRKDDKAPAAKGGAWSMLRLPALRRAMTIALVSGVGWNLYTFLFPVYGAQAHLSASQIGTILSVYSFASVVSRSFAPWLGRRYTPWQVLLGSLTLAAAGFMAAPLLSAVPVLMVLSFWLGLTLGIGAPMSMTLMFNAAPPGRLGEVQGMRLSMINALQTVVPFVAGFLGAALGVGMVFWGVALVLVVGVYATRDQWHAHPAEAKSAG